MEKTLISIEDLIRKGWLLYTNNFQKFVYPILIMLLPEIILFLLQYFFGNQTSILFMLLFVVIIFIELWMAILFIEIINKIYNNQIYDLNKLLEISFKKIPSYFWVTILTGLVVVAGLILLIIPGIIFAIWYAFSTYVNVLEEKNNKGLAALKTSKELVKGRFGSTFWRLLIPSLLIYLMVMIVVWGLTSMFTGGQINSGSTEQNILINTIFDFIIIILSPLFVSFGVILYNSLKETKSAEISA